MRPVRVRFTVPQDELPAVLRGRATPVEVRVSAGDDSVFANVGRLVFVDNAVEPTSGTLLLKGEFENRDENLWPGEFVRVRLMLAANPNATVVPSVAVTSGPEGPFVYVVEEDSTVSVRPVVVQRVHEDLSIIARGVQPGETVVTDGQLRLGPGVRVVVRSPRAPGQEGGAPAAQGGRRTGSAHPGEAEAATRGGSRRGGAGSR